MKKPPYITATELGFVKAHMLLDILLSVFERDKTLINASGIKTPAPYIDMIDRAMDAATVEIKIIRQQFRLAGIKVHTETRDSAGFSCKYVCRGYAGQFRLLNSYLAASVEVEKRRFLGEDITRYLPKELMGRPMKT
jgi:hypothetical protein